MKTSNAKNQEALRARRAEHGIKQRLFWLNDEQDKMVKEFIAKIKGDK